MIITRKVRDVITEEVDVANWEFAGEVGEIGQGLIYKKHR